MSRLTQYTVSDPERLDRFLTTRAQTFSRSQIQKHIASGRVRVNNQITTEPSHALASGDTVAFQPPPAAARHPEGWSHSLAIVHEDADIIVINKPVGLVTHPNHPGETGTLVNALVAHIPSLIDAVYDPESALSRLRPGIVHRLDKETSGLLVVAKHRDALHNLAEQFHNRTVAKEYETVLYGALAGPQVVTAPIKRKGGSKNLMVASHNPSEGRSAHTEFYPQATYAPYPAWPKEHATQCRVVIKTGRTHQIRVHAKFIGHPVLGDRLYSNKPSAKLSARLNLTHQLLHAAQLTFIHPGTGKEVTFSAPAPFTELQ